MGYLGYVVFCYILGWVMTGYFVVRLFTDKDIRFQGSGNIGALNSGRAAGVKGFILTFLGDSLKGGIAVALGIVLDFPEWVLLLGLTSVIAGHIWPLPFRFQGGKGVATFLGGLFAYHSPSLLFILIVTGIGYLVLKEFTAAGLAAILIWPIFQIFSGNCGSSRILPVLTILPVLMIVWAHRSNVKRYYQKHLKTRG